MRFWRWLPACLRWALTLGALAVLVLWAGTWRGRLIWVLDPASCGVVVRRGVVMVAWPDGSAIEKLVNRVAGLPALPAGPRGTSVLLEYRQRLYDSFASELTMDAMQFEPRPLVHAGFPWVWLGARHNSTMNNVVGFQLPLWVPALVLALGAAPLWWPVVRRWRLARAGRCASCGYDRRGLAAGAKCPECGGAAKPV